MFESEAALKTNTQQESEESQQGVEVEIFSHKV